MKISQMIDDLQEILDKDGDLEVYTMERDGDGWPYLEEAAVEVRDRQDRRPGFAADVLSPYGPGGRRNPGRPPERFVLVV